MAGKNSSRSLTLFKLSLAVLVILCCVILERPNPPKAAGNNDNDSFANFEAPQVHPLAITPDGTRLLALNTPDNRLAIFQLGSGTPTLSSEIQVGLQPVSIAVRDNNEAWVANWLSDSISIVDLSNGNIKQTIDVGDEPTDIAFLNNRAIICVSGLRQVKIFDLDSLSTPPKVVTLEAKKPRTLTVDPANQRVFVSIFESGNKTSLVPFPSVRDEGGPPPPHPAMSPDLPPPPRTALMVKEISPGVWADETGDTKWSKYLPYTLEDTDVAVIDLTQPKLKVKTKIHNIGTHIGNAVYEPSSNTLVVLNTESHNEVRFEPNVKGKFIDTRLAFIDLANIKKPQARQVNLNPHINYDREQGSDNERKLSLGIPDDIVRTSNGIFYVSATSTSNLGVLNSAGQIMDRIQVGQGPTGLALDEARQQLYVLNKFEGTLSIISTATNQEINRISLGYDPEPSVVREGRFFLFSGSLSAHGDISCASCHRDGHRDGLSWDLGDPTGKLQIVETPDVSLPLFQNKHTFHPMKGPMNTQTLRGILDNTPLHWRGDRSGIEAFNGAFVSLLGGPRQLTDQEMALFKGYVGSLTYPPNPLENLDRTYPNPSSGPNAEHGRLLFSSTTDKLDIGLLNCIDCHDTNKNGGFGDGTNNFIAPNFLLVGKEVGNDVNVDQDIKVPQLRGLYEKSGKLLPNGKHISGFGFINDGYRDRVFDHISNPRNFSFKSLQDTQDVEAFVLSIDTGTAPTVGLQVTVTGGNKSSSAVASRIKLLMEQANKKYCDLVIKGIVGGVHRGYVYAGNGMFKTDKASEAKIPWQALVDGATDQATITFTGVPVGEGRRIGIDRNNDGVLDGDQ